ncbi:HNH endonuclease signature motif containing protein [Anaeromyxobacter sp. PSR-1]|uniref:HNH endonuclease signature motif containing protein n=1 Tax=Anaeromyxobacter sp. PSR-1 TaxID=1300915 RepID=UPI0009E5BD2D
MHPGCSIRVRGASRCPQHQQAAAEAYAQRQAQNREKRADRYALYRTPEWRRLRAVVLAEEPTCRMCGEKATVVDHITPHLGDLMLFLDRANLQALCKRCHDSKTCREDGGFGHKRKEVIR